MNVWEGGGVRGKDIQGRKWYIRGASSGKRGEENLTRGLTQGLRRWETQRTKRN